MALMSSVRSTLLLVILLSLLGFLQFRLWTGEGNLWEVSRLKDRIDIHQEEIKSLTLRNQRLSAEVQALKTTPAALEERARSELGMIKEGEVFCVVVEPIR